MSTLDISTAGDTRSLRGLHLAQTLPIKPSKQGWHVPSQSGKGKYTVALDMSGCTCLDFEQRQQPCKHIYAVEHMLEGTDIETVEVKPVKPTSSGGPNITPPSEPKKLTFSCS